MWVAVNDTKRKNLFWRCVFVICDRYHDHSIKAAEQSRYLRHPGLWQGSFWTPWLMSNPRKIALQRHPSNSCATLTRFSFPEKRTVSKIFKHPSSSRWFFDRRGSTPPNPAFCRPLSRAILVPFQFVRSRSIRDSDNASPFFFAMTLPWWRKNGAKLSSEKSGSNVELEVWPELSKTIKQGVCDKVAETRKVRPGRENKNEQLQTEMRPNDWGKHTGGWYAMEDITVKPKTGRQSGEFYVLSCSVGCMCLTLSVVLVFQPEPKMERVGACSMNIPELDGGSGIWKVSRAITSTKILTLSLSKRKCQPLTMVKVCLKESFIDQRWAWE